MWEEAGVPGENPRKYKENMETFTRESRIPYSNLQPQNRQADVLTALCMCCPKNESIDSSYNTNQIKKSGLTGIPVA